MTGDSEMGIITGDVSCGITDGGTLGNSVVDKAATVDIFDLRRIMNHAPPPRIINKITTPPIIIISDETPMVVIHFEPSACLNTRSRNPISSFPIFIPNVTFRRSDSVPPRAESSCTIIFIEIISPTLGNARNTSRGTPCSVRIADGNVGSFLIDSHISRVEPERLESFFGSILIIKLSLIPERDKDQSS